MLAANAPVLRGPVRIKADYPRLTKFNMRGDVSAAHARRIDRYKVQQPLRAKEVAARRCNSFCLRRSLSRTQGAPLPIVVWAVLRRRRPPSLQRRQTAMTARLTANRHSNRGPLEDPHGRDEPWRRSHLAELAALTRNRSLVRTQ
jgi:hypothetical protein